MQFAFFTKYKKWIAVGGLVLVGIVGALFVRHTLDRRAEQKYLESYGQTALELGSYSAKYDLYRYFYLNYAKDLTGSFTKDGVTDTASLDRAVRARTAEAVQGLYACISVAEDYGFTVTDGDVCEVADTYIDAVKAHYKQNGGSFAKDLAANRMTEEVFLFLMRVDALENKLFDALVAEGGEIESNDEKLLAVIGGEEFVRAKLIFIENDTGEDPAENARIAAEALAAYKDGTPFDTLIGRYSEDYSMPADGYYFTHLEMIDVIEAAAFSMRDGEISDVLESEDGYYLLLRLPKEAAYITEHFDDLKSQYQSAVFYKKLEDRAKTLPAHETAFVRNLTYEEIR